jgi:hypothetical protein
MTSLAIDAKFPAGNIIVERIDGDTVFLRPDLRDTEGDWFYWCFRVRGAEGRTLTFQFTRNNCFTARGPAISLDNGLTWRYLGKTPNQKDSFTYSFPPDQPSALFSMGMPYTQRHWDLFTASLPADHRVAISTFCRSRKGRGVESLATTPTQPRFRLLLSARHHACEMMASYVLEGLLHAATADDDVGRWFAGNLAIFAVPFVDKDGVEDGDQGKNRRPRDHNRDYDGQSVHLETAALRSFIPSWHSDLPLLALDLHCPWIASGMNETVYQAGSKDPAAWAQQQRFARCLAQSITGPIPYSPENDLPYGKDWNTDQNYLTGRSFGEWARSLPNALLATSLETPYALASGQEVNQTTARQLGRDLAAAIRLFCTR